MGAHNTVAYPVARRRKDRTTGGGGHIPAAVVVKGTLSMLCVTACLGCIAHSPALKPTSPDADTNFYRDEIQAIEIGQDDRFFFSALPLGVDPRLPVPRENRLTAEKVELGRRLFFDERLSRDGSISCATCHLPERAFSDGRPIAEGIDGTPGRRNAPTLLNAAYLPSLFRDGRSANLEEQALAPLINPVEMDNTYQAIARYLGNTKPYLILFERAFGSAEVSADRVSKAIASYERTLVSGDSAFDRYEMLGDATALSESAKRGLELFRGKARCHLCHEGRMFTDGLFHNTGVSWGEPPLDLGRFEVTGKEYDKGAFRTPGLRDVSRTAPYMHNGSLSTLDDVLDFYNDGGVENPYLDFAMKPLDMSADEKADLKAFLEALSGRNRPGFRPPVVASRESE